MGRAISRKQSKTANSKQDLDEGRTQRPTQEEYARMGIYNSFVVTAEDGRRKFRFERDQVVLVLPHGFNPKEVHPLSTYWAARIKDIRAHHPNSVWVRVQWFYSGKDVSDVVKSFDRNAVGRFERIYSDHQDFIQPEAFETVIPMYKLNEVDPEQIYIPQDAFFRRYTFEYLARNLQPKPGLLTCVCQKPYDPDDTDPQSLMHFCPRPSCRIAFHHRCLVSTKNKESSTASTTLLTVKIPTFSETQNRPKGGDMIRVTRSARKHASPLKQRPTRKSKAEAEDEAEVAKAIMPSPKRGPAIKARRDQELPSLTPRSLRLLGCSPDTDDTLDLRDLVYSSIRMDIDSDTARVRDDDESDGGVVPRKGRRGRPPKARSNVKVTPETPTLESVLATIPFDLLTIAMQPLVRGGAFPEGGVAGNIGMVTRARRLVHTALQMGGGESVAPDWKDTVFGNDRDVVGVGLKNAVVSVMFKDKEKGKKDKGLPPFVCPNCRSAI